MRRLRAGWSQKAVLRWLNARPSVRRALRRERIGKCVVTDNNLSLWLRSGAAELADLKLS